MIPAKGKEPGAFVVTSNVTGKKYVMMEETLKKMIEMMGEANFEAACTAEWVVLTEAERKLAEKIRLQYFKQEESSEL